MLAYRARCLVFVLAVRACPLAFISRACYPCLQLAVCVSRAGFLCRLRGSCCARSCLLFVSAYRACRLVFVFAVRACPSRLFFVLVALACSLLPVFLVQASRAGFVVRVVLVRACLLCLLLVYTHTSHI